MSVPVRLRRVAQVEYDEAVDWYEARRAGLGVRFLAALQETIQGIAEQPDRWAIVQDDVREVPVSGWPYCLYYQVRDDHVMVIAVFHTSRDPAVWQRRA